jgi:error-prone DNA polymerase
MFLTLEDETGPLNVIVWPKLFERFRRAVFSAGMMGVEGRLQKEGEVIHVIADRIVDLTPALRRIAELGSTGLRLAHGRGRRGADGGGVDTRGKLATALGVDAKEDYNPDLLINRARGGIAVRPRNFR